MSFTFRPRRSCCGCFGLLVFSCQPTLMLAAFSHSSVDLPRSFALLSQHGWRPFEHAPAPCQELYVGEGRGGSNEMRIGSNPVSKPVSGPSHWWTV